MFLPNVRNFMSIRGAYLSIAALAVLLLAAGCGGGDSSSTSADEITVKTSSLSKAEFIKRADAVCEAARKEFDREYNVFLRRKFGKNTDERVLQAELADTVIIPSFAKEVDGISALGAPNGDEQEIASFLKALQKRLNELHEDSSELSNEMFNKPAKLAIAYGLNGCAKSLVG
jgi:hypothetical protein